MKQHLLFDIDLLLDTRIATLHEIDPQLAIRAMEDDGSVYRKRKSNHMEWLGLAKGVFDDAYRKRSLETLKLARPTYYLFELSGIASQLIALQLKQPHKVEEIEFHINTYPYRLTPEETDGLISAIRYRLPAIVNVKAVHYAIEDLSPQWIKASHYTGVFIYQGVDWLNTHYGQHVRVEDLVQMPSIDIHLHAYFEDESKLMEAQEYQNPVGETCDIVTGLRVMFAPYFHLELISPFYTSIVDLRTFTQREMSRIPKETAQRE